MVGSMVIDTLATGSVNALLVCLKFPLTIYDMEGDGELMLLSAKQVKDLLKEEAHVFVMFSTLGIDNKVTMGELTVVCDFPEVFLDDISDLPPECAMEFAIDLVPGSRLVSMAPYRMFASKLGELKK
ncbi:uncharacterized protein LOC127082073 [Lathyrus oleraceus]|uniref:uncharacterized protein LOC127082073 n=1 Tax=Pisum sativum TaxID=3888 RepID=UPI0021D21A04|nr:uncharacterized protein LOC127082073 [Pisum sativum]